MIQICSSAKERCSNIMAATLFSLLILDIEVDQLISHQFLSGFLYFSALPASSHHELDVHFL